MPLLRVSLALPEIQAATVEEITRYKLEAARSKGYERLIVEDVSLGFDELGNFPGPYIKWLLEGAGGKGLGAIAYALLNRSAKAQCCLAYWDGHDLDASSSASAPARCSSSRAASRQFGWDPWFKPHGSTKTFAEMPPEEKDAISHRGRAYAQLREHLRRGSADT